MAAPVRKHGSKNRKKKVVLEFDEHARSDYLKGFHKRKVQRKKDARDKKEKLLQNERKVLRKQIKDLKTSTIYTSKSYAPIPELEQLAKPEVFDMPEHTVTITDFGGVDFVGKTGVRMGLNTGELSSDTKDESSSAEEAEEENGQFQPQKEAKAKNKSLLRQLATCSNQLGLEKSKRANKKRDAERRFKDRKIRKKKNNLKKGKKK